MSSQANVMDQAPGRGAVKPLAHRVGAGVFWSLITALASRGAPIVSAILVARALGPEGLGEWSIVQRMAVLFAPFAGLGLSLTATTYLARYRHTDPARAGRVLGLILTAGAVSAAAFAGGLWVLRGPAAHHLYPRGDLAPALALACPALLFLTMSGTLTGALAGFEAFRRIAAVGLLEAACAIPLTWLGCVWFGLPGAVAALTATSGLSCLLAARALYEECRQEGIPVRFTGIWAERPLLLGFAAPCALSGGLFALGQWLPQVLLLQQPGGAAELAGFVAADQLRMLVTFVPTVIGTALLPILASSLAQKNYADHTRAMRLNLAANAAVGSVLACGLVVFRSPLLGLYGDTFRGHAPVLVLMAVVGVLAALANAVGNAIAARDRMWHGMLFNLAWAATLILTAAVLVPRWSGPGLAAACLIAYGQHFLGQSLWLSRLSRCDRRA